jgi:hypothetical protein
MREEGQLQIPSYRAVFHLERRIYRIDRLVLNPSGVPLRGIVYGVCLLFAAVVASRVPVVGSVVGRLPWWLRFVLLPAGLATALGAIRLEGRVFHQAVWAYLAFAARRLGRGGSWPKVHRLGAVLFLASGSEGALLPLRYHGPGALVIRGVQGARRRGRRLVVYAGPSGRERAVFVPAGQAVELRPASGADG